MPHFVTRLLQISSLALVLTAATGCPDQTWSKTYGGADREEAFAVLPTQDGGYLFVGSTVPVAPELKQLTSDVYIVKTNASGVETWSNTIGLLGNETGLAVEAAPDGGYMIAGSMDSVGAGGDDAYILKIGASGTEQWSTSYGGRLDDVAEAVRLTDDGGYIVAGRKGWSLDDDVGDAWLFKISGAGAMQWEQSYGGKGLDGANDVQQTSDGGFIVAGFTTSPGEDGVDAYLVKMDAVGTEQWSHTYGDGGYATAVVQTVDGGYATSGLAIDPFTGDANMFLLKTDTNGIEQWTYTHNGPYYSRARALVQSADGGFVMAGTVFELNLPTKVGAGGPAVLLVKTDAAGIEQWAWTYGGSAEERASALASAPDGGYIVAGASDSFGNGFQMYAIKTNSQGLLNLRFPPLPLKSG